MINSKIILGTVQFGLNYGISNSKGITGHEEVSRILEYCTYHNISFLDTANAYGRSQEVLGNNNLKSFEIVSKFMTHESVDSQLDLSLNLLGIKRLYAFLAHRPLEISSQSWDDLIRNKKSQKIKKIGFSFNDINEIDYVISKGFIPDIVQVPYNFLDDRFEDWMKLLKGEYGTEIHTRSAFLQGLFFLNPSSLHTFFDPIKKNLESLWKIENKAGAHLKYVASKKFIDKVVIGVNDLNQLKSALFEYEDSVDISNIKRDNVNYDCIKPVMWPKN